MMHLIRYMFIDKYIYIYLNRIENYQQKCAFKEIIGKNVYMLMHHNRDILNVNIYVYIH